MLGQGRGRRGPHPSDLHDEDQRDQNDLSVSVFPRVRWISYLQWETAVVRLTLAGHLPLFASLQSLVSESLEGQSWLLELQSSWLRGDGLVPE